MTITWINMIKYLMAFSIMKCIIETINIDIFFCHMQFFRSKQYKNKPACKQPCHIFYPWPINLIFYIMNIMMKVNGLIIYGF